MPIQFIKSSLSDELVQAISQRLHDELAAGHRVLWIITGGSSIPAEVDSLRQLHKLGGHLANLSVALSDERFGPVGHADSNWTQLAKAGFDFSNLKTLPILTEKDASLESAVLAYEQAIAKALARSDVIIAQLGIGADGHLAGILPNSPAVGADTNDLVTSYQGRDFVRITLTTAMLEQVTAAYLLVTGAVKQKALVDLRDKDRPLSEQPAQLLKALPEVYIFNDQL